MNESLTQTPTVTEKERHFDDQTSKALRREAFVKEILFNMTKPRHLGNKGLGGVKNAFPRRVPYSQVFPDHTLFDGEAMEWEQTGPVDFEVRAYVYSLVSAVSVSESVTTEDVANAQGSLVEPARMKMETICWEMMHWHV